jgi:hypothetical protein
MPWAANRFIDDNPFFEGRGIVSALRADRIKVVADANEEDLFAERVAGEHLSRLEFARLSRLGEVRPFQLIRCIAQVSPLKTGD